MLIHSDGLCWYFLVDGFDASKFPKKNHSAATLPKIPQVTLPQPATSTQGCPGPTSRPAGCVRWWHSERRSPTRRWATSPTEQHRSCWTKRRRVVFTPSHRNSNMKIHHFLWQVEWKIPWRSCSKQHLSGVSVESVEEKNTLGSWCGQIWLYGIYRCTHGYPKIPSNMAWIVEHELWKHKVLEHPYFQTNTSGCQMISLWESSLAFGLCGKHGPVLDTFIAIYCNYVLLVISPFMAKQYHARFPQPAIKFLEK